ncbi:ATP-dependent RNA helicase [Niveomyces insectorum RCEF 264]|uniref:RNA helicase n=1 Tax=Niveomyces insectorum RCEF 264 TaxID=1081102 RepID=A0A167RGT2_9HYPO|nr:ATP-dependent RNA helicase [Niveomyces insectorum RCEF 264]
MLKATLGSICPVCRLAVTLKRVSTFPPTQPWRSAQLRSSQQLQHQQQQQRFVSSQRQRRKPPSRMVLSDTVARPPTAVRDKSGWKAQRRADGPFSGMNRTVANVLMPRPSAAASAARPSTHRTRERESRGGRSGPDDKKSFKALRMQQSLATIGYGQRSHIKTRLQEVERFDQLNLLPSIQSAIASDALRGLVDVKPTPIQRLAIPALLGQTVDRRASRQHTPGGRREFLLAAETGSGKTLAYLLPVVDALKRAEAADEGIAAYKQRLAAEKARRSDPHYRGSPSSSSTFEPHPTTARPRVVILVPSAELVGQVGTVAKTLSHAVKFKTDLLAANVNPKVMERNLYSPAGIDVVVATPHLLASVAESDPNVLSRVSHLVIDEADSLLDRSFSPATTSIVERALPSLQQLILCSATIPRRLDKYLATHFPHMQRITTPNLHAIPRRVQLGVLDVSKEPYRNNKNLACADAIWSIGKDVAKTQHETSSSAGEADDGTDVVKHIMVFVNEREKTQEVADFLQSKGIDAVALHRDASEHRFTETLALFTSAKPQKMAAVAASSAAATAGDGGSTATTTATAAATLRGPGGRTLPNTKVIVATDLASRGIDTLAVRHVVLYDVPHTTIDFIHRLGRAGRMGRRGRGIVLVGKDDRRDVVAEVRESMYMGQALV